MKKRISPCLHGMRCVSFIVYAAKPPNEGPKVPSLGVAQFSKAKPPNEGPKVPSLGVAQSAEQKPCRAAKPPNEGPKGPSLGVAQCMVAVHVG